MNSRENIKLFVESLAARAKYGIHGEKPLAIYAILSVMRSDSLLGITALQLLSRYADRVRSEFLSVARTHGRMKSASGSWSVIAGSQQELQNALCQTDEANRAFEALDERDVAELLRWYEIRFAESESEKVRSPSEIPSKRETTGNSDWLICSQDLPHRIQAWSAVRLPYPDRRDRCWSFRVEMQRSIRQLKGGAFLCAEYGGPDDRTNFDLENVLLYNLDPQSFSSIGVDGFHIERRTAAIPPAPNAVAFGHYYRYEIRSEPVSYSHWTPVQTVRLTGVALLGRPQRAGEIWALAQQHLDGASDYLLLDSPTHLGLEVLIHHCPRKSIEVFKLAKPLIDGILCCCHSSSDIIQPQLLDRLVLATGHDAQTLLRWLGSARFGGISSKLPVKYSQKGLIWSPDDHLLRAVTVLIAHDTSPDESLDITLQRLTPARSSA